MLNLVYDKEYIPWGKERRVTLNCLPCRYIRVKCTKGAHIHINSIEITGFYSEDADNKFGEDAFEIFVSNPKRLLYGQ
jgi:hypothetical protein